MEPFEAFSRPLQVIEDNFFRLKDAIGQADASAIQALVVKMDAEIEKVDYESMVAGRTVRQLSYDLRGIKAQLFQKDINTPNFESLFKIGDSTRYKSVNDGVVYPVWYGTNRKANSAGVYSTERTWNISFGKVLVHVPEAHRFGETGNSFWRRLLRFDLRNDRLLIQNTVPQTEENFFSDVSEVVAQAKVTGERDHALIFLHGYNVTFEDAAIQAAQIGYDLKILGPTLFFSWPSRGKVKAYPADEATIQATETILTDFITKVCENCATEVHIVSHSLGCRGLMRALQRISSKVNGHDIQLSQIFLAAPDIDRDLFIDLAHVFESCSTRTTMYTSNRDLPVHASALLHGHPRAGYFEPHTRAPGIDTIVVPNFNVDLLGHSYFSKAEALLHDIYDLIRNNQAPVSRQRLQVLVTGGAPLWSLRR